MANFTNYVKPDTILCPKDHVKDVKVIYDGTKHDDEDYSIALLRWKDEWTLGIRWNLSMREAEDPAKIQGLATCVGVPISFSHPVWFILPSEIQNLILQNWPSYWVVDDDKKKIIDLLKEQINS